MNVACVRCGSRRVVNAAIQFCFMCGSADPFRTRVVAVQEESEKWLREQAELVHVEAKRRQEAIWQAQRKAAEAERARRLADLEERRARELRQQAKDAEWARSQRQQQASASWVWERAFVDALPPCVALPPKRSRKYEPSNTELAPLTGWGIDRRQRGRSVIEEDSFERAYAIGHDASRRRWGRSASAWQMRP